MRLYLTKLRSMTHLLSYVSLLSKELNFYFNLRIHLLSFLSNKLKSVASVFEYHL